MITDFLTTDPRDLARPLGAETKGPPASRQGPISDASSIDEPLFVPVARDGSWFSPTDCHQADGQYHVGNGADEMTFKDYGLALDFLTRAASPRWRYTDTIGRWRTKTATSWERKARHEVISVSSEGSRERTKRAGRKA
jgi:hypothetical protein